MFVFVCLSELKCNTSCAIHCVPDTNIRISQPRQVLELPSTESIKMVSHEFSNSLHLYFVLLSMLIQETKPNEKEWKSL